MSSFKAQFLKSLVAGNAPSSMATQKVIGNVSALTDYAASHSAGFVPQRQGTGAEDRRFRAALQPQTATFYLDSYGGFHSPEDRPTLLMYFRDATLGGRRQSTKGAYR